jgi:hypothetical protein
MSSSCARVELWPEKLAIFNVGRRDSLQNQPSINRTNNRTNNRVGVSGVVAAAVINLFGLF